jgi:hypothetical protein
MKLFYQVECRNAQETTPVLSLIIVQCYWARYDDLLIGPTQQEYLFRFFSI